MPPLVPYKWHPPYLRRTADLPHNSTSYDNYTPFVDFQPLHHWNILHQQRLQVVDQIYSLVYQNLMNCPWYLPAVIGTSKHIPWDIACSSFLNKIHRLSFSQLPVDCHLNSQIVTTPDVHSIQSGISSQTNIAQHCYSHALTGVNSSRYSSVCIRTIIT